MYELSRLSKDKYPALHRYFEGSVFTYSGKSWRVVSMDGDNYSNHDLEQMIATAISRIKRDNDIRNQQVQQNLPPQQGNVVPQPTNIEKLLEKYGQNPTTSSGQSQQSNYIESNQVKLIEPLEADIELYPSSFHCSSCNYYEIESIVNKKQNNAGWTCPSCNGASLNQTQQVFACLTCGKTSEMSPTYASNSSVLDCPDNDGGHLLLDLSSQYQNNWGWICTRTRQPPVHNGSLYKNCVTCTRNQGSTVKMRLTNTSATFYKPLEVNTVLFGDDNSKTEEPDIVSTVAIKTKITQELTASFGIDHIDLAETVHSVTATFGYCTYGNDAIERLFDGIDRKTKRQIYKAFVMKNKGRGLLVCFDKKRIAKAALTSIDIRESSDPSTSKFLPEIKRLLSDIEKPGCLDDVYSTLVQKAKDAIADKKSESPYDILFKILHSFEHSLSMNAALATGLEAQSFGGMVMMEKCSVLIFEKKEVTAGGIDFLIEENNLHEWIFQSKHQLCNCKNGCDDSCPKCIYCNDALCHPVWPKELPNKPWISPNSLLSRVACNFVFELWNRENLTTIE